eukprot:TRINITY_DN16349_c0_g1_i1.p2 TRINITY_DN16349_c0_g1~~TRINITY_DN16349_c0_g1_i1.p2  ORF type:complete len:435 (+),score=87.92 TRINITY_DN16349_c0_g1_i1:70-1374(+)
MGCANAKDAEQDPEVREPRSDAYRSPDSPGRPRAAYYEAESVQSPGGGGSWGGTPPQPVESPSQGPMSPASGSASPGNPDKSPPPRTSISPAKRSIVTFSDTLEQQLNEDFRAFSADSAEITKTQSEVVDMVYEEDEDEATKLSRKCSYITDQVVDAPPVASLVRRASKRRATATFTPGELQRRMSFTGGAELSRRSSTGGRKGTGQAGIVRKASVQSGLGGRKASFAEGMGGRKASMQSADGLRRRRSSRLVSRPPVVDADTDAVSPTQSDLSVIPIDDVLEAMTETSGSHRPTYGISDASDPEGGSPDGTDSLESALEDEISVQDSPPPPALPSRALPPLPDTAQDVLTHYVHSYSSPRCPRCATVDDSEKRPPLTPETLRVLHDLVNCAITDPERTRAVLADLDKKPAAAPPPAFSFARKRRSSLAALALQ